MVEAGYRNKVGAATPRGPQPRTAQVRQARGPSMSRGAQGCHPGVQTPSVVFPRGRI